MCVAPSQSSLKTRCEADGSTTSISAQRRKARVSQLKALQARRAAEEAERAVEARRRVAAAVAAAAAAAAEAEAQLVLLEARTVAQRAADAAEVDALECKLLEEDELGSQSSRLLAATNAPFNANSKSSERSAQRVQRKNDTQDQPAAGLPTPVSKADSQERTERWVSGMPCGGGQRRASALPKISLEEFSGSPLEWPRWSGLFMALVHENAALSDTERVTYLQSCLTGEAREAVRGLLCDGRMYAEAMDELESQFGDPRAVVTATLGSVLHHRSLGENDMEGLMHFSRALHAAVSVLSAQGFEADLAAVTNLEQILEKLPRSLAWQWGQVELKMAPRRPTLSDIDQWLRPLVLAGRRVLSARKQQEEMASRAWEAHQVEPADRRRGSEGTNRCTVLTTTAATEDTPCPVCVEDSHQLDRCPVFTAMPPVDRLQLARDSKRCYRCLGASHWASMCQKRLVCGESGCRGRHHPLLHVPDTSSRRAEDAPVAAADQPRWPGEVGETWGPRWNGAPTRGQGLPPGRGGIT